LDESHKLRVEVVSPANELINNPVWLLLKHAHFKFDFTEVDSEAEKMILINGESYTDTVEALKTLGLELGFFKIDSDSYDKIIANYTDY